MENNQNQLIKQALQIVAENNKFALNSIANNKTIKTNFYKLSSDIDVPGDIRTLVDKESESPVVISDDKPSIPTIDDLLKRDYPSDEPGLSDEHDSLDEPIRPSRNVLKRPINTGLMGKLESWTLEMQAKAIFQSEFEYAAEQLKLSKKEIKRMSQDEKDQFMISCGLKTLDDIRAMNPKERAKYMGQELSEHIRMPSSRILNTHLGRDR